MSKPSLIQALVQDHHNAITATPQQHSILRCIARCRTAAAGTHTWACLSCGAVEHAYNCCGNRHCPLCQAGKRKAWVQQREEELLPISYFHVVLTLPHELLWLARLAPRVVYDALLKCSRQAIADLAANPKHLGAEVGQVQVLHTWGSDLRHHPHVHTIVTGGGLTPNGDWQACRLSKKRKNKPFLVPVRALASRMRTLMLGALDRAYHAGDFAECNDHRLAAPLWRACLRSLRGKQWVAYAKRPFAGPACVVRYLGRYTHRVAISDARLSNYTGEGITLHWTDYAHHGQKRATVLTPHKFLHRFLQHVLPPGFRRIRLAGFLAPRARAVKLALARKLLGVRPKPEQLAQNEQPQVVASPDPGERSVQMVGARTRRCPHCDKDAMVVIQIKRPLRGGGLVTIVPAAYIQLLALTKEQSSSDGPYPTTSATIAA